MTEITDVTRTRLRAGSTESNRTTPAAEGFGDALHGALDTAPPAETAPTAPRTAAPDRRVDDGAEANTASRTDGGVASDGAVAAASTDTADEAVGVADPSATDPRAAEAAFVRLTERGQWHQALRRAETPDASALEGAAAEVGASAADSADTVSDAEAPTTSGATGAGRDVTSPTASATPPAALAPAAGTTAPTPADSGTVAAESARTAGTTVGTPAATAPETTLGSTDGLVDVAASRASALAAVRAGTQAAASARVAPDEVGTTSETDTPGGAASGAGRPAADAAQSPEPATVASGQPGTSGASASAVAGATSAAAQSAAASSSMATAAARPDTTPTETPRPDTVPVTAPSPTLAQGIARASAPTIPAGVVGGTATGAATSPAAGSVPAGAAFGVPATSADATVSGATSDDLGLTPASTPGGSRATVTSATDAPVSSAPDASETTPSTGVPVSTGLPGASASGTTPGAPGASSAAEGETTGAPAPSTGTAVSGDVPASDASDVADTSDVPGLVRPADDTTARPPRLPVGVPTPAVPPTTPAEAPATVGRPDVAPRLPEPENAAPAERATASSPDVPRAESTSASTSDPGRDRSDGSGTSGAPANPAVPRETSRPDAAGFVQAERGFTAAASAPVASAATAPAPHTPPMGDQLMRGLGPVLRGQDGSYQITLQLAPAHLGKVDITLEMRGGEVAVVMRALDSQARELLRDNVDALRSQLAGMGLDARSIDVDSGGFADGGQPTWEDAAEAQERAARAAVRDGSGFTLDADTDQLTYAPAPRGAATTAPTDADPRRS